MTQSGRTQARPGEVIRWLGENGQDSSTVGGKAANLSVLAARGFRVPPGFSVSGSAAEFGRPEVATQVERAYGELVEAAGEDDVPVAVRSSAVDEDGAEASFAGQNETFLNVRGVEHLVSAMAECVASFTSERARAYRVQHGLQDTATRYSVLVQQLVVADTSGVVFSADPVSGDARRTVVNVSWGLGESIVGGTVTPDTFVVDRCTGDVLTRAIAEKDQMTVATSRGVREVRVPRRLAAVACLSDEQIRETAELAAQLERSMGWPVDVEFAWTDGRLHLLQCRPITTGAPDADAQQNRS
jgi:pyruvate,water dikinase